MKLIKGKLGFTLIELLAVMVILAIILAIAVPSISGIISSATKAAFKTDVKMVLQQIETIKLEDDTLDETLINESNIKTLLGISDSNYEILHINIQSEEPHIFILGKNRWKGLKACGTIMDMQVVSTADTQNCIWVNKPRLAKGMTAIKWKDNDWVKVDDPDNDISWYDYANGEWANAVTNDCEISGDYDTCSMWVWIPRYAYKIETCYNQNSTDCSAATGKNAGEIDVKFLIDDTNKNDDGALVYEDNASNTHHVLHPAFTFGDKELIGIWVAKFEVSVPTNYACYETPNSDNCNNTDIPLRFVPNVSSRRHTSVNNLFISSRNMEKDANYGWTTIPSGATLGSDGIFSTESGDNPDYNGIDTHMMKNIEWGAVAYLSQSQYGKYGNDMYTGVNKEIYQNKSSTYITGSSNGTPSQGSTLTQCAYNDITDRGNGTGSCGGGASTTGNIYGIYDMSGGAHEYVMGNYDNEEDDSEISDVSLINNKYIDIYTAYNNTKYGDAIFETSSSTSENTAWYRDCSLMITTSESWLRRGGSHDYGLNVGVFQFNTSSGGFSSNRSGRSVILVGADL